MTPLHNLVDSIISRNNDTFFQFSISSFSQLFLPTRLTSVLIAEDSSSAQKSVQGIAINGGFIFPVNLPHWEEEVRKVYG